MPKQGNTCSLASGKYAERHAVWGVRPHAPILGFTPLQSHLGCHALYQRVRGTTPHPAPLAPHPSPLYSHTPLRLCVKIHV